MPLPQKRWFRIADVARRWDMALNDIEDHALDEALQLAVFVAELPAEAGDRKTDGPLVQILNGPQALLRASLLEIFRDGQAQVRAFRGSEPNKHLHIMPGTQAMLVRRDNLIVTREERDRFERDHGSAGGEPQSTDLSHSEDFSSVRVDGKWHSFGPKQAAVLRLLKAAGESDNPWLDGKRLLDEADASTMRLVDLFKRKPTWRRLVLSDGKGRYRLNAGLLSPERRRVRLFRKLARGLTPSREAIVGR